MRVRWIFLIAFASLAVRCATPDPVDILSGDGSDSSSTSGSSSGSDSDSGSGSSSSGDQSTSYVSIAGLKNLYVGSSHPVVNDLYIEGRVTANDLYGEYSRAMVVEDATAAIEVRIDSYDLHSLFAVGSVVRVVCSDLWLSSSGGATIIGAEPDYDDYLVGYISGALLERSVVAIDDSQLASLEATEVEISQLGASMISCRVRLCDLEFVASSHTTFASRDAESGRFAETVHTLCDTSGRQVELVVASTVVYAEVPLPSGLIDLEAIVEYGSIDGLYALRLVDFKITL